MKLPWNPDEPTYRETTIVGEPPAASPWNYNPDEAPREEDKNGDLQWILVDVGSGTPYAVAWIEQAMADKQGVDVGFYTDDWRRIEEAIIARWATLNLEAAE